MTCLEKKIRDGLFIILYFETILVPTNVYIYVLCGCLKVLKKM